MKVPFANVLLLLTSSWSGHSCYAFMQPARTCRRTSFYSPTTKLSLSSPFNSNFGGGGGGGGAAPTPDDEAVREEYARWRQKYNKGEFNPTRYENFKSNFVAVTAKNNMELQRARQSGEQPPPPIKLNEYGDFSAEEYRARGPGSARMASTGLRPTNDFNNANPNRQRNPQQQQQMAQASTQLRATRNQRTSLEGELGQLKARLEEKQRLLQAALTEEQYLKNRIALREEQKRILNDRLRNGWEDERGF
jgi:hypothetical protein